MVESMWEIRLLLLYLEKWMASLFKKHQLIFKAIKKWDADEAKNSLDHLIGVEDVLSKHLD